MLNLDVHGASCLAYQRQFGVEENFGSIVKAEGIGLVIQDILLRGLSMSTSVKTRKMVNYAFVLSMLPTNDEKSVVRFLGP